MTVSAGIRQHLARAVLLMWGLMAGFPLAHADEFLEPEVAFKFSVRASDGNTLEARWQIADGYYMYRDKFRFKVDGGTLGTAKFPAGKIKEDENFGRVEIYRKDVRIVLPVSAVVDGTVKLTAVSQGCADAGLCYTPQTTTATLKLPKSVAVLPTRSTAASNTAALSTSALTTPVLTATASATPSPATSSSPSTISGLRSLTQRAQPKLLPPDQAFLVNAAMVDARTARFTYTPTENTYLYRDKLSWTAKAPAGIRLTPTIPPGEVKEDPTFGKTTVFHQPFAVTVKLSRALVAGEKLILDASWQGCNEAVGICYPPSTRGFTLASATAAAAATGTRSGGVQTVPLAGPAALPPVALAPEPGIATSPAFNAPPDPVADSVAAAPASTLAAAPAAAESDTRKIERVLQGGSFWAVVAVFFGFGLFLALTPCVFPMIPILSGIIAGQNHAQPLTKTRGFLLSAAYVLGMAITYAAAGVAAALSGTLISAALQNPWALGAGAAVFVALALSMFGFYEIQLPSALQSKFSNASNKMKGGNFLGVFVMGAFSAVIVGPCVAPPLAAALGFIAQTGNTVLGASALFAMAIGMGVPLLLVGVSAGALLPRAGGWMNAVKYAFGVAMLGIAIYLISPVIPAWIAMLLWALLLIGAAVYLSALDPLPERASGWKRLWKGIGVALLVAGLALVVGVLGGSRDVLQPLAVFRGGVAVESTELEFNKVKSVAELDAKLAAARASGQPVMLDFYADWCKACKEMELFTFADARVQARLQHVLLLKADVTGNTVDDAALLARFKLFGPPGMIFWRADGSQSAYTVIGFEKADAFLASLDAALS